MRPLIGLVVGCLVAGCAQHPPAPPRLQLPPLQLSPASFGSSVSLVQRLVVRQLPDAARLRDGTEAAEQSMDAQVEIDPGSVRLAAFAMNQRVLLLQWNGRDLRVERHPMLPDAVDAAHVLRDVQLVYWPLAAVAAALPPGWAVSDDAARRSLSFEGQAQVLIDYSATPRWQGRAMLDNRREGYRLTIESSVQP